jgi:amicyanin
MGVSFFNQTIHDRIMTENSRIVFCLACTFLLILASVAAGCSSYQTAPATTAPPSAAGGGNAIAIQNFAFEPATMTIKTGDTVTWTNKDGAPHTIVADSGSPVQFSSSQLSTGNSYSFTFTQAGSYTYHCSIHPSMKGTIVVQ